MIPIYYFDRLVSNEDGETELCLTIRIEGTIVFNVKVLDGPDAKDVLLAMAAKAGHKHLSNYKNVH
jgi:hypothetical protein